MNQRFDLIGRTVIITGGGKGIGKVYSEEFAKAGAHVVAADIDGAAAKSVAEALVAQGLQAVGLATDIASEASTKAMAEAAIEAFGAIDVLVNNASLMSVLARRSWLDIPVEGVGPGDGGQSARHVPVLPRGVSRDEGARAGQDRQHLI